MRNINKWIAAGLVALTVMSYIILHAYQQNQIYNHTKLVIYRDGEIYDEASLSKEVHKEITVRTGDHFNIIEIKGEAVRIKEADCPRKICVDTGWLNKPGQIAVCIPNRLKIVIEGQSGNVDDIAY